MTAREIVEAILNEIPGERLEQTVDTFKAGDPDAEVVGIVTTFMATLEVLRCAVELGANMVITHEPTFYGHRDQTDWLEGDPVLAAKRAFIEQQGLIIWRFHDYWHRHEPDGIGAGVIRRLGWLDYQDSRRPNMFHIPETTLADLVETIGQKLGADVVRATGNPAMSCRSVVLLPGAGGAERQIHALQQPGVDVVVSGESPEWTTCEYVRDAVAAGRDKALVLAGHCNSEEAGMEYLAEWLRPHVGDVQVTFVPAGDPFWSA